jgi:capsular polysaccharide biosynthesis protein
VIHVLEETNYEHEKTRIRASGIEHMAANAYQLRDAILLDGVVFANGTRIPYVLAREKLARYRIETTFSAAAIPSSVVGNRYFGHFIMDDACTALLALGYAPFCFVASDTPRSAHQERYLNIYGIPYQEARTCHFEELWVFDDFAMNHHKQARLQQLREKARALPGSRSGHGVFFRRRGGGMPRNMINEAELEDQLAQRGLEIIDVNQESVDSIIWKSRDAAVVIGIEGSALMHGLMTMQPGSLLLCLQPPDASIIF